MTKPNWQKKYFSKIETLEKAEEAIRNSAIVALIIAGVTFVYAISGIASIITYYSIFDVFLILVLALGIYYGKSRVSSMLLLFYSLCARLISISQSQVSAIILIITAVIFYYLFRGCQGTFAYHRIKGIKKTPTLILVKNTIVFSALSVFIFFLIYFLLVFVLLMFGIADTDSFYEITFLTAIAIAMLIVTIMGLKNKLPGINLILTSADGKQPRRKVNIFGNMFDFSFDRSFIEAIGFYIAYLIIIMFVLVLLGGIGVLIGLDYFSTAQFGNLIAVISCLSLALVVLIKKNFIGNLLFIFLGLISVTLSIYGGAMSGLIFIAYLSTFPANKNKDGTQKTLIIKWYHQPWFAALFVVLAGLYLFYSIFLGTGDVSAQQTTLSIFDYWQLEKTDTFIPRIKNFSKIILPKMGSRRRLSVADIAQKSNKSIVYIEAYNSKGAVIGFGSGFIVSGNGIIATNHHVIANASSLAIALSDGTVFKKVELIEQPLIDMLDDVFKQFDLSLLKVKADNLPKIFLGDANLIKVGEEVVAIGNPIGYERTVSKGIISAKRESEGEGNELLQHTAAISPGSSGGPLFNMYGEVIGINTLKISAGENINFAVPINYLKWLIYFANNPEATEDMLEQNTEVYNLEIELKKLYSVMDETEAKIGKLKAQAEVALADKDNNLYNSIAKEHDALAKDYNELLVYAEDRVKLYEKKKKAYDSKMAELKKYIH